MSNTRNLPDPLNWTITPWLMNGQSGWKQQPVILVEGRTPFFADHPDAYIERLQALHDDPLLIPGSFWTYIGQLRDALEQAWNVKVSHAASSNRNGDR